MAALVNKSVRLSEEQITALKEEAKRDRRDLSELVRIAVDDMLAGIAQRAKSAAETANGSEAPDAAH